MSDQQQPTLDQAAQTLTIIWGAMFMGVLAITAVGFALRDPANAADQMLVYGLLFAGLSMVGPFFVLRMKREQAFEGAADEATGVATYNGLAIACLAMAEAPGMIGGVSLLIGAPLWLAAVLAPVSFAMLLMARPDVRGAARSFGGAAVLLACLVLAPAALADGGLTEREAADLDRKLAAAAKLGVDRLIARQRVDGSFEERRPRGFKLYERHSDGTHGVVGLAILAQRGDCPAVRKVVDYLLKRQRDDGCLAPRASKCNLEHGYCMQLLVEVARANRAGRLVLTDAEWARLHGAIRRAARYLLDEQNMDGSWGYGNGWGYRETATLVPVLEALLFAGELGVHVPGHAMTRAARYIATRAHEDGFFNGEKERIVSPHTTASMLSLLELLEGPRIAVWRARGRRLVERFPERGMFARWGWEPTDPSIDQYAKLKLDLAARRILYSLYYQTLARTRRAAGNSAAWCRLAGYHLLRHRGKDGMWSSTAGDLPSTALAVLTLSAPRASLGLYGKPGALGAAR